MKLTSVILPSRASLSEGESVDGAKESCSANCGHSSVVFLNFLNFLIFLNNGGHFRLLVDLSPCCLRDWGNVVRSCTWIIEAFVRWFFFKFVVISIFPRPKESEHFVFLALVDGSIELGIITWSVRSLEVSEPVKVDSTLHSVFKGFAIFRFDACDSTTDARAVGKGLGSGDGPVVVGSGLGALGEDARGVGNLVADHGGGAGRLDVVPGEVVSGAGVLPVGDTGERQGLALRLEIGNPGNIGLWHLHVHLLAVPYLVVIRVGGHVHAPTILNIRAHSSSKCSNSVTVELIGVLTFGLLDVGPQVNLKWRFVATIAGVDHVSFHGIYLVRAIVRTSNCGLGGGNEESESE